MEPARALVTGAARRLGRAMALDLAAAGWDVAIHCNGSADAAAETAEAARQLGVRAEVVPADLLSESAVSGLIAQAAAALGGPLSLLINNASIFEKDRLGSITRASWDRAIDSNLYAPARLIQDFGAQAPQPLRDDGGEPRARAAVINMLDQRLLKPTPFFASYTLAKAGLGMLTKTAAQALAPGIRVNAIAPGPTIRAERQSEAHFARQRAACLLGRGSDPEDILAAMRFILGCKALTGQMIAVDGGQHLVWQTRDVLGSDV